MVERRGGGQRRRRESEIHNDSWLCLASQRHWDKQQRTGRLRVAESKTPKSLFFFLPTSAIMTVPPFSCWIVEAVPFEVTGFNIEKRTDTAEQWTSPAAFKAAAGQSYGWQALFLTKAALCLLYAQIPQIGACVPQHFLFLSQSLLIFTVLCWPWHLRADRHKQAGISAPFLGGLTVTWGQETQLVWIRTWFRDALNTAPEITALTFSSVVQDMNQSLLNKNWW